MRKTILVVGDFGVELLLETERLPFAGETVVEERPCKYLPVGGGIYSAMAINRLGADGLLCAKLGNDANAGLLRRFCEREGADARFLVADASHATALTVSIHEDNGNRHSLRYPGASPFLTREDMEEAFIAYPELMLIRPQLAWDAVVAAARLAEERKIPAVLDVSGPIEELPLEELPPLDVLLVNEEACEVLTCGKPLGPDACLRACVALSRRVVADYYVLKLGDRGSYVYDGKYYECLPSFDVDEIEGTGAGEVFTAAFLVAHLNGAEVGKCCEFANAAAALSISRPGVIKAFPTLEEVKHFLADRV